MRRLLVSSSILLGLAAGSCSQKTTESTTPPAGVQSEAVQADPAQLGGTWLVQRINGQAVPAPTNRRAAPQLIFETGTNRVGGSTGCNRLMGSYTATGSTISFGQLASTKVACMGATVEPQMLAALNTPGLSYQLSETQLTLLQGSTPVLVCVRAATGSATSQNSLDWAGTYVGTLPCADCQGIETQLTLNADATYRLRTAYLGKPTEPVSTSGSFSWDPAGRLVRLSGLREQPTQYLIGEKMATQLDMNGQRVSGNLADKYVLRKQ